MESRPAAVHVGDPAPEFTLPRVQGEGTVSLADYRGKFPLLLVISRGLWCSFCRRYIAQLGGAVEHLRRLGVETLAIVASDLQRSRLYLRHWPIRVPLAADPDRITHRGYALPMPPPTPEVEHSWQMMRVQLDRTAVTPEDLSRLTAAAKEVRDPAMLSSLGGEEQMPLWDFVHMQRRLYPYQLTESEQQEWTRNMTLGTGQFLIDQNGVIRWMKVQSTTQLPAGLGNHASQLELLAAVNTLTG